MWYLEKKAKINAVCLVTLTAEGSRIESIDSKGNQIDQVSLSPQKKGSASRELSWLRDY